MPIVFSHSDSKKGFQLAIWDHATDLGGMDPVKLLTVTESEQYHGFKSASRKAEFLTVRRLLQALGGNGATIVYKENGRPHLSDGRFISITHSGTLVGVMISDSHPVGIDLEAVRPNITRIASKFVSDDEHTEFGKGLDEDTLHVIWCAKEILFKLYAKGNVDFRKDLTIRKTADHGDATVEARIDKIDFQATVIIEHRRLNDYVLAWGAL